MISSFRGPYFFLSNFYHVYIHLDGLIYPSVEHAYQASKTFDRGERLAVCQAGNPAKAKRIGRHLSRMREDWSSSVKLDTMRSLVSQKFKAKDHHFIRHALIATGSQELIEGNTWNDTFWGVCDGEGLNHLGRILMDVRGEIVEELGMRSGRG